MAEYNKVYASIKPELPKVIQQEQIYVYAPKSSRAGMKSISSFDITAPVAAVLYDTTDGITVVGESSLVSEEVSGEKLTQNFQSEFRIPIKAVKGLTMDADSGNDFIEIGVDKNELSKDFIPVNKTQSSVVPRCQNGQVNWTLATSAVDSNSIMMRDGNGDTKANTIYATRIASNNNEQTLVSDIIGATSQRSSDIECSGESGTLPNGYSTSVKLSNYPSSHITNNYEVYHRMKGTYDSDPSDFRFVNLNYDDNGKLVAKAIIVNKDSLNWTKRNLIISGSGGDGLEQIISGDAGIVQRVDYDADLGAEVQSTAKLKYTDSTDGSTKTQTFPLTYKMPIVPGKYISIDANSGSDAIEVKVDDTQLALDYISIDKSKNSVVPQYDDGKIKWITLTGAPLGSSVVARDGSGNTYLNRLYVSRIATTSAEYDCPVQAIYYGGFSDGFTIEKTSTDTGTLTAVILDVLKAYPNAGLKYDNQLYRSMDPQNAPDGTLNYIHIDSLQDGSGRYKATGKCFSITVSTRAWQVVDIDFGNANRTTHNLTIENSATGTNIYFSLTDNRVETYEGAPAGLWTSLEGKSIACTVDANGIYASGIITTDGDNFRSIYGNGEELLMTQTQISITDNIV